MQKNIRINLLWLLCCDKDRLSIDKVYGVRCKGLVECLGNACQNVVMFSFIFIFRPAILCYRLL